MFSSLGLSKYASILGTIAEVSLVTDCAFDESSRILANTLFYCVDKKIRIGRGVSIGGVSSIDEDFSRLFDKNALYFTMPYAFPDGYERVIPPGSPDEGLVYLSFFITQREHELFIDKGADVFENILEDKDIDPFDIKRVSSI